MLDVRVCTVALSSLALLLSGCRDQPDQIEGVGQRLGALNRVTLEEPAVPRADRGQSAVEGPGGTLDNDWPRPQLPPPSKAELSSERLALELTGRSRDAALAHPEARSQPAVVRFGFADLMTSTGPSAIQVVIANRGYPLGQTPLGALSRRVKLMLWPSRTPVPSTTSIQDVNERGDGDPQAHIFIHAQAPLQDRWHALSVEGLPAGYRWDEDCDCVETEQLRFVRFHPNERLVVSNIRVCQAKDVFLEFSERVQLEPPPTVSMLADNKAAACSVRDASGHSVLSLRVACDDLSGAQVLGVHLAPDVVALSGRRPSNPSHTLNLADLRASGPGCVKYSPPDPLE